MAIYLIFALIICVLYSFSYYLFFKNRNYWKNKNVPFVKPLPLFGNYKDCLLLKRHMSDIQFEICQQFPNEPYIGSFYGTSPALIIKDPNLIKLVMSKEFYYFSGRDVSDYNQKEIFTRNVVLAHGDEWNVLRTNLTSLFLPTKLKNMFYLIKKCSDTLENLLVEEIETRGNIIEVESIISKYTMDCITACVFGLCSDTMKKNIHKNPYVKIGENLQTMSTSSALKNMFRTMWPGLFYALGFKIVGDDVAMFFNKLISGVFKTREETKISRNDFVDLILSWKAHSYITGDSLSKGRSGKKNMARLEVNEEFLIAQCEILFVGAFDTTAAATSYLLYELAKNKAVQARVIEEIDEYFGKHETIEYECINSLPYTEACLKESLRLNPVFGMITREVMHEYSLPTGLCLKKGDRIHIPVRHIHHNPVNFPMPEIFRPERFLAEEARNIKLYTYLPFGEGPRICLGRKFAKMPIYAALLKIFKSYRLELAENMSHKISYNPKAVFISHPISSIHLKFIPRKFEDNQ